MDVHFDDKNVVQPDLIFVSIKRSSIIQKWIYGAPDFLVEILSKSTKEIDQTKKKKLYGQHDVLEYWIVNPEEQVIEVFHNQNKELQLVQTASKTDEIKSIAIDGFVLKVETVF
jgi:Uma2 family endonuclease